MTKIFLNKRQFKLILWLATLVFLFFYLAIFFKNGFTLDSNILSLFPDQKNNINQKIANQFIASNDKKITILCGHQNISTLSKYLEEIKAELSSENIFAADHQNTLNPEMMLKKLLPYKSYLTPTIKTNHAEYFNLTQLNDRALASIINGLPAFASQSINNDPLLLTYHWLENKKNILGENAIISKNSIFWHQNNKYYSLLQLTCTDSIYSPSYQNKALAKIDAIKKKFQDQIDIHYSGSIVYHHHFRTISQTEINLIGGFSLIAIIFVFLVVFRSLKQLLMVCIAIAFALISGLSGVTIFFEQVHSITLVFGATIIGVTIDYSFHYLAHTINSNEMPEKVFIRIRTGLLMGGATSIIAYLSFFFTDVPILRQMAIFSTFGIVGSIVTIWFLFPSFSNQNKKQIHPLFSQILNLYFKKHSMIFFIIISTSTLLLVYKNKEASNFIQEVPKHLLNDNKLIQDITNIKMPNHFLISKGNSQQEAIEKNEDIIHQIINIYPNFQFSGISTFLSSIKTQKQNDKSLDTMLKKNETTDYLRQFDLTEIYRTSKQPLSIDDWNELFPSLSLNRWVHHYQGYFYAITIINENSMSNANIKNKYGQNFYHYTHSLKNSWDLIKQHTITFLQISIFLVLLIICWRYGLMEGFKTFLKPVLALLFLSTLVLLINGSLSLGHLLGLIVLLGIGVDYTIFLKEDHANSIRTYYAIILSALSSIISFGVLSFSQINLLNDFGTILLLGITYCFLINIRKKTTINLTKAKDI